MIVQLAEIFLSGMAEVSDTFNKVLDAEKKVAKEKKEVFEKSSDMYDISPRVIEQANRLANGSNMSQKAYLALAAKTDQLICYALYYMTTYGAPLIDLKETEKDFVNGISSYIGFGKIYRDAGVADIHWYDAKNAPIGYCGDYLLCVEDLDDLRVDQEFDLEWRTKLAKSNIEAQTSNEKYISASNPIFDFDPDNFNVPDKKPENMPEVLFLNFEAVLEPLLRNYKYFYDQDVEKNWNLCIVRDNGFISNYILDNGSIMGGSEVSILASYANPLSGWVDTVFVPVNKHRDIVGAILDNQYYIMGSEAAEIFRDHFNNGLIYKFVDFTNTCKISRFSAEEKKLLERTLQGCLNVIQLNKIDYRFRFMEFDSPIDYVLIADDKAASTLQSMGATASINYNDPVKIQFKASKIIMSIGSEVTEYEVSFE